MPLRASVGRQQSRRIAELLVEQGLFGVGLIDSDLRITAVNDAVGRITGYDREELIGISIVELAHPDDRAEVLSGVRRLLAGEVPSYSAELRGRAKDGRVLWGRLAVWPLRDERGRIMSCLGVLEDVTEAHRDRERMRHIEERIRHAMVAMTDARDPKQVLQSVVDLAREVLGAQYAALGVLPEDGDRLTDFLVSGVDKEAITSIGHWPSGKGLLGAVTTSQRPIRLADLTRYPDSRGFPPHHPKMRSFLGVPIAYKGRALGNLYLTNKIGAADFTSEDEASLQVFASQAAVVIENARMHETERHLIEELDSANKDLERASESKSVFLASMSHELRTPLHAMLMAADILRDPEFQVSDERAHGLMDTIATSGRHLLGLIDDLLELSRIESGRFGVRLEPASLTLLLTECRQATAPLADRKGIHLDIPEIEEIWVEADPLRARQALINLLVNAVRFTDPGGRVWIEVDASAQSAAISVCDTGRGIAPEDIERVFNPFEQAGSTRGVGLGLAISRSIARAHGGALEVRSELGKGSRFRLTLRRSHRRVAPVPREHVSNRATSAGAAILVAEDDPRALDLTIDVLRSAGYVASGAGTVAEAMDSVHRSPPDLVLLDIKLGPEDGLDVARQLRGDPVTRDIPVLATSASISDADVERAKDAGCVSFLPKPLTPRALLRGVRACLDPPAGGEGPRMVG